MELETHKKPTHPKYGLSNGYERFDFQLSPMYDPICWSHGGLIGFNFSMYCINESFLFF